jgi:hypothetical protein
LEVAGPFESAEVDLDMMDTESSFGVPSIAARIASLLAAAAAAAAALVSPTGLATGGLTAKLSLTALA